MLFSERLASFISEDDDVGFMPKGTLVLMTVLDIGRLLPLLNEGDGVGHMLTVVGLFTVCVCLIVLMMIFVCSIVDI